MSSIIRLSRAASVRLSGFRSPPFSFYRNHLLLSSPTLSHPRYFSIESVVSPNAPKAIGPYSQAVKANGFLFVSGCLGLNPKTGDITGDVGAQTKQALENMKAVLAAGNSSFEKVVKTTIFLADIKDFPVVNEIYAKSFTGNFPARSTIAVKSLPKGGLVEIEAIAVHS